MMTPEHEARIRAHLTESLLVPANHQAALYHLGIAEGYCRQVIEALDELRAAARTLQFAVKDGRGTGIEERDLFALLPPSPK